MHVRSAYVRNLAVPVLLDTSSHNKFKKEIFHTIRAIVLLNSFSGLILTVNDSNTVHSGKREGEPVIDVLSEKISNGR